MSFTVCLLQEHAAFSLDLRAEKTKTMLLCATETTQQGIAGESKDRFLQLNVNVLVPNGGELWEYSPSVSDRWEHLIFWSSSAGLGLSRTVVSYTTDGSTWSCIADSAEMMCPATNYSGSDMLLADDQSFLWEMPTEAEALAAGQVFPSATCLVQVQIWDTINDTAQDTSDGYFYIVAPSTTSIQTLIIWNAARIEYYYGPADRMVLAMKLAELAGHHRVQGRIFDLGLVAPIDMAYQAWDLGPFNPDAANNVAREIRLHIQDLIETVYTNVRYLILVGDDVQIPFFRMHDGTTYWPENKYPPEVGLNIMTTVGSALAQNYFLTDNYYAEFGPEESGLSSNAEVYLNDCAPGRLVETPTQMVNLIDSFLAWDGLVLLDSMVDQTLVTGYTHLYDSALARKDMVLAASLPTDCLLDDPDESGTTDPCVDQPFTGQDLENQVFSPLRHKLTSIDTVGNHYNWEASTGFPTFLSTSQMALNPTELLDTVLYSSGCHSGLPVPLADPNPLDLPEEMAEKKVMAFIGNTGYGWGMRYGQGLTEQLLRNVTSEILEVGSISVGQALSQAKRSYYLDEKRYDVFDEKVMHELTLFGIPNTHVELEQCSVRSASFETLPHPVISTQTGPAVEQVQNAAVRGTFLPPGVMELTFGFSFPSGNYLEHVGPDGIYYTLFECVSNETGSPKQPLFTYYANFAGSTAHGVLLQSGTLSEVSDSFDPVIDVPRSNCPDAGEGGLPAALTFLPVLRKSTGRDFSTGLTEISSTNLVMHTGFVDESGTREFLFDEADVTVYYSNYTDTTDPVITDPGPGGFHLLDALTASFTVEVSDASGVYRVLVTYQDCTDQWQSFDLTQNGVSGTWEGSLELRGPTRYFVQAVDNCGNVGQLITTGPDEDGAGLEYGSRWVGAQTWVVPVADTDDDCMPDLYEDVHSCLDKNIPDHDQDPDWDTLTSNEEMNYSTDPCLDDMDRGYDNDGSEILFGRNPFFDGDDLDLTIFLANSGETVTVNWGNTHGNNAIIGGYYYIYRATTPSFFPSSLRYGPLPVDQKEQLDDATGCDPCFYKLFNVNLEQRAPHIDTIVPDFGPAGMNNPVEINGSDFQPGAQVFFCGAPALDINVLSPGKLICLTPANPPHSCNVMVLSPNGKVDILLAGYTFE